MTAEDQEPEHNATTQARADQVLELLVAGLTRREILSWAETKTDWKLSDRSVDRLIAAAGQILDETAAPKRERELTKALRRLDMLFARCLQITDFKGALAVERERIALLGLSKIRPQVKRQVSALRWGAKAAAETGG